MLFYLLYDAPDPLRPYGILTSEGHYTGWLSMSSLLRMPLREYTKHYTSEFVASYLLKPDYPIIATFDHLPTIESNPELFL